MSEQTTQKNDNEPKQFDPNTLFEHLLEGLPDDDPRKVRLQKVIGEMNKDADFIDKAQDLLIKHYDNPQAIIEAVYKLGTIMTASLVEMQLESKSKDGEGSELERVIGAVGLNLLSLINCTKMIAATSNNLLGKLNTIASKELQKNHPDLWSKLKDCKNLDEMQAAVADKLGKGNTLATAPT